MQSLRDKNKNKNSIVSTWVGIVLVLILLLTSSFIFPPVGNFFRNIASPIFQLENGFTQGLKNIGTFFASKKALMAENTSLKEKNTELEAKMIDHTTLEKENSDYKKVLIKTTSYNSNYTNYKTKFNQLLDKIEIFNNKNIIKKLNDIYTVDFINNCKNN